MLRYAIIVNEQSKYTTRVSVKMESLVQGYLDQGYHIAEMTPRAEREDDGTRSAFIKIYLSNNNDPQEP